MSKERTTMAKIAERSGVNLPTVSLASRDTPCVGPNTRQRTLEVARNLVYIPPTRISAHALASGVTPSLTTMHVDKLGMGRLAVHMLVKRVNHPESSPVTAVVRPRLIERDSVLAI